MKKSMLAAAVIAASLILLTGCGKKDPAYLSGIKAADYVDLADYQNIAVEVAAPEVSDDYLELYTQYQLSMNTQSKEITDRNVVQSGDIANIDYVGKKDGVAFEGGTASGYDLTIGSGSFIDGFEDGLIGVTVGDEVTLDLTFPEDYGNADLAGAAVTFDVKVNSISERVAPELTDEYAAGLNIEGVSTADEYKEYLRSQLMEQAQSTYDSEVQGQAIQYLIDNSTFKKDPPQEMVERMNLSYTETFTAYASQYGLDLATFMSYQGSDAENYENDIREMATETAKEYIIMQAIADMEKLEITDKEFNTALSTEAARAGYKSVEEFKKEQDAEAYREYLLVDKVVAYLLDNVAVSEPAQETGE